MDHSQSSSQHGETIQNASGSRTAGQQSSLAASSAHHNSPCMIHSNLSSNHPHRLGSPHDHGQPYLTPSLARTINERGQSSSYFPASAEYADSDATEYSSSRRPHRFARTRTPSHRGPRGAAEPESGDEHHDSDAPSGEPSHYDQRDVLGTPSEAYSYSSECLSDGPDSFDEDEREDQVRSLTRQLAETAVGVREMSKQLGRARVKSTVNSVLIITKAKDNNLVKLTRELAIWLMETPRNGKDRGIIVYVDHQLRESKRFDAEGIRRDHPEFFKPLSKSNTSPSGSSMAKSSNSSVGSATPNGAPENGSSAGSSTAGKEEGLFRYWTPDMCSRSPHLFDFVVTLGGDGTVLYCSWLFQRVVPPVMPFALGSLGFLTNFNFPDYAKVMDSAIEQGIRVNLRMRFTATVYRATLPTENAIVDKKRRRAIKSGKTGEIIMRNIKEGGWDRIERPSGSPYPVDDKKAPKKDREVMCFSTRPVETFEVINDLVVDRGPSPYVSLLEVFGDEHHMTTAQADGLCISTPTGSTAYSLSAGGSLVHPEIPAILITPICPHTLSFRPMLLPDSMELRIAVPYNSRSTAWASFDGRGRVELKQGDHIKVTASRYPFPTIRNDNQSSDWFQSISRTLKWNERQRQKSFVVVEEGAGDSGNGEKKSRTKDRGAERGSTPGPSDHNDGGSVRTDRQSQPGAYPSGNADHEGRHAEHFVAKNKVRSGGPVEMAKNAAAATATASDDSAGMVPQTHDPEGEEKQAIKANAKGVADRVPGEDHLSGPAKVEAIDVPDRRRQLSEKVDREEAQEDADDEEEHDTEDDDEEEEEEEEKFDIDDTSTATTRATSPQNANANDAVPRERERSGKLHRHHHHHQHSRSTSFGSNPASQKGSLPPSHRASFDSLAKLAPFTTTATSAEGSTPSGTGGSSSRKKKGITFEDESSSKGKAGEGSGSGSGSGSADADADADLDVMGSDAKSKGSGGSRYQHGIVNNHRQSSLLDSPDRFALGPPAPPRALSDRHMTHADFRLDDVDGEEGEGQGQRSDRQRTEGQETKERSSQESSTAGSTSGARPGGSYATDETSELLRAANQAVKGVAKVLDRPIRPSDALRMDEHTRSAQQSSSQSYAHHHGSGSTSSPHASSSSTSTRPRSSRARSSNRRRSGDQQHGRDGGHGSFSGGGGSGGGGGSMSGVDGSSSGVGTALVVYGEDESESESE